MYCIYSGKEIAEINSNIEHIIPLSLGGCDELIIRVDKNINSKIGSQIDGKLTQDFLIALDRVKVGNRGHSNKEPMYTVQAKTEDGKPLISTFTTEALKFFDPKEKVYVDYSGKISMSTNINLDLRLKFVAKVALAVGYFLFEKRIEDYTDCDALRMIITTDNLKELLENNSNKFEEMRFYDSLHEINDLDKPMMEIYTLYCQYIKKSNILWTYSSESIIVHVAIFGKFVGLINFKAKVDKIPHNEDDWLGHIMICDENRLIRKSWRAAILEMAEANNLLSEDVIEEAKKFKG